MLRGRGRWVLLPVVALGAATLALLVAETRTGRTLERRAYDGWFTLRGALPRPTEVVIVAVDPDSERALGRYPWSREWHAHLIRNLHRAGARVVAFDITFADAMGREDRIFREAIDAAGIAVLGVKSSLALRRGADLISLEEPAPDLAGSPVGVVDISADPLDGVIREYPILHHYLRRSVPQLGIKTLLRYLDLPEDAVAEYPDGWRLGDLVIPRGPAGGMLINYAGPTGTISTYSFVDVVDDAETDVGEWTMDIFEDLLEEGRFRDRIVLVGSTIPEHQDLHPTPVRDPGGRPGAAFMPGVEIHAHAVATILAGAHLRMLPRSAQYAWAVFLALLATALTARLRGILGAGAALILLLALAPTAAWFLFSSRGLWLWSVAPALSVGLAYAGSAATLYFTEAREKARIRGMFQRYMDRSLVDELIQRPELLSLGGEERVVTVLFSDLVGFSSISEHLPPHRLVELLNEYMTAMTDVILAHGGIIDKYQGDAIMAEFGVPLPLQDHALRACRAALRMQQDLAALHETWKRQGKPLLDARIGINTGEMLVGNLGSRQIMDYTVMGDNVNLGARLEGANRIYGTRILVSESTSREVEGDIIARELDRIRVKGRSQPIRIYEILGTRSEGVSAETTELVAEFERILRDLFHARRFAEAKDALHELAIRFPEDGPTRVLLERCDAYIRTPPATEWDGVFTLTAK